MEDVLQQNLPIIYKGHRLKKEYIANLICYDKIIVELKTLNKLSNKEKFQLLNYLKATGLKVGLFSNFGSVCWLEWKQFSSKIFAQIFLYG